MPEILSRASIKDCGNDKLRRFVAGAIIALSSVAMLSTPVFADYKIILKNGREFIVDNYKEINGKIKFYKMGGEIELDKSNIEDIKKVKSRSEEKTAPAETTKMNEGQLGRESQRPPSDKPAEAKAKRQDAENRLKEIAKRKEEMKAEKDKLDAEKKKLEEDMKEAGRLTYPHKMREFERRSAEITEKIDRFNEELGRLNQEEGNVLKDLKPAGQKEQ